MITTINFGNLNCSAEIATATSIQETAAELNAYVGKNQKNLDNIVRYAGFDDVTTEYATEHEWFETNGKTYINDAFRSTPYLTLAQIDELYITTQQNGTQASFGIYDKDKKWLGHITPTQVGAYFIDKHINVISELKNVQKFATAEYVRACSRSNVLKVKKLKEKQLTEYISEKISESTTDVNDKINAATRSELDANFALSCILDNIPSQKLTIVTDQYDTVNSFIVSGGTVYEDKNVPPSYVMTNAYIPIQEFVQLFVTVKRNQQQICIALYDAEQKWLGHISPADGEMFTDRNFTMNEIVSVNPAFAKAKYVRICSNRWTVDSKFNYLIIKKLESRYLLNYINEQNYLYGKKLVVAGDSFSSGYEDVKSPGKWITAYPGIIASRNKMVLKNKAVSGMALYDPDQTQSQFYGTYFDEKVLPELNDADYFIMSFGLNGHGTAEIGTVDDDEPTTVYGVYNNILSAVLSENPALKIGIVINDGWMTTSERDVMLSVGHYWGFPVLDLRTGEDVPSMIQNGTYGTYGKKATTFRNHAFMLDEENENYHPNQVGQIYRSTIIENYIRQL